MSGKGVMHWGKTVLIMAVSLLAISYVMTLVLGTTYTGLVKKALGIA